MTAPGAEYTMPIRVLIIEDESLIRWSLRQKFEDLQYEVAEAETGTDALKLLKDNTYDLVVLDYRLPDTTGLEVLRQFRREDDDTIVILMTAYSNIEDAVEAIKLGAFDYLPKPFDMDHLLLIVDKALEATRLRREVRELRCLQNDAFADERVIGQHPIMVRLFDTVDRVAASGASTIFLRGETGTGKDLLARVIHHQSDRADQPFMNITCTALSEQLLESELFGHERGAFTDAKTQKKGLFELADGGTVFLDEVGDMPLALQAKLLRFLEEHTFRRVGGTREISVDVRVIAATNSNLEHAIREGRFRRDLMFRLNVVPIYLPPLRERGDDVRHLAQYFVNRFANEFKKGIARIDEFAYDKLSAYAWPGNVRELRNVCERAVLLCNRQTIAADDVVVGRSEVHNLPEDGMLVTLPPGGIDFHKLEGQLLRQALARSGNNQTKAAQLLRLTRDTFRYRLEKHSLL